MIGVCPSFLRKPSLCANQHPAGPTFLMFPCAGKAQPIQKATAQPTCPRPEISLSCLPYDDIAGKSWSFSLLNVCECNIFHKSSLLRDHSPRVPNSIWSAESSSPLFPLSTQSSFPPGIRDTCFIHIFSEIFWASNFECHPFAFAGSIPLSLVEMYHVHRELHLGLVMEKVGG